jgi:cytochrome d ubiquinol oxidase subunit II
MQKLYNKTFVYSSFITPLFLGIIAGSAVSGAIDLNATTFSEAYIFSWLNFFSIAVGLFTVTICGYLAAIFIIEETDNEDDRKRYIKKARHMTIAALCAGVLVFIAAYIDKVPLYEWIFGHPVGIIAISAAGISLIMQWVMISKGKLKWERLLAGFQVAMILLAVSISHFPNIVVLKGGGHLSLIEHAGHVKTIYDLGLALLIGSVFILPALYYLIYSFHKRPI